MPPRRTRASIAASPADDGKKQTKGRGGGGRGRGKAGKKGEDDDEEDKEEDDEDDDDKKDDDEENDEKEDEEVKKTSTKANVKGRGSRGRAKAEKDDDEDDDDDEKGKKDEKEGAKDDDEEEEGGKKKRAADKGVKEGKKEKGDDDKKAAAKRDDDEEAVDKDDEGDKKSSRRGRGRLSRGKKDEEAEEKEADDDEEDKDDKKGAGKKGKKKDEDDDERNDGEEEEEEDKKTSKPTGRRRGRPPKGKKDEDRTEAKEDDDGDEDEEEEDKKASSGKRRGRKPKAKKDEEEENEDKDDDDDEEEDKKAAPASKRRGRPPKAKKDEDDEEEDDEDDEEDKKATAAKRRGRSPKAKKEKKEDDNEEDKDDEEEEEDDKKAAPAAKRRGRPNKAKKEDEKKEDDDDDDEEEKKVAGSGKRRGRPPKSKDENNKDEEDDDDKKPTPGKRRGRHPKSKKDEDKDDEEEESRPAGRRGSLRGRKGEDDEEEKPAGRRGRAKGKKADDDDGDDDEEGKKRPGRKGRAKANKDDDDEEEEEEKEEGKKMSGKARGAKRNKGDEDDKEEDGDEGMKEDEDEEEKTAASRSSHRRSSKRKKGDEDKDEDEEDDKKASSSKQDREDDEDDDEEDEEDDQGDVKMGTSSSPNPRRKSLKRELKHLDRVPRLSTRIRRTVVVNNERKNKAEAEFRRLSKEHQREAMRRKREEEDEEEDDDDEDERPKKKTRGKKGEGEKKPASRARSPVKRERKDNASARKRKKDEEEEEDDDDDDDEEESKKRTKKKKVPAKPKKSISSSKLWITDGETSVCPVGYASEYKNKSKYDTTEGVIASSREFFRAVLEDNAKLLQALLKDEKHLVAGASLRPWSVACSVSPLQKAIELDRMPLVKILVEAEHIGVDPPQASSLRVDGGSLSFETLGVAASRKVGVARGGKEGNNALIADILNPIYPSDAFSTDLSEIPFQSTRMLDYLRILDSGDSIVHSWGMNGFYAFVESGNYVLAGKVATTLKENDGFGLNHLHVEALTSTGKKPLTKFTKPQIAKKTFENNAVTPIHCAAINAKTTKPLEELLDANPSVANKVLDRKGRTPMHFAAASSSSAAVKVLIKRGFETHMPDKNGTSPLALAARFGRHHNVKLLAKKDDDSLNNIPKFGKAPVVEAACRGHAETVKVLLQLGADAELVDSKDDKKMPIHHAASRGHLEVVKVLVEEAECDVSCEDKKKRTPLIFACMNGHSHVVAYLLSMGASSEEQDSSQNWALHYAAAYGWLVVCKLLVEAGANANVDNDWKIKPHVAALLKGHTGVAQYLMEQSEVSINDRDNSGRTLLSMAMQDISASTLDQVRFMVEEKEADVTIADLSGFTPLHYLASSRVNEYEAEEKKKAHAENQCKILKVLLDAGADLGAKSVEDSGSLTPLMVAMSNAQCDVTVLEAFVEAVVERKIDVAGREKSTGQNVLHKMVQKLGKRAEAMVDLTKKLCDLPGISDLLKEADHDGFTPLLLLLQNAIRSRKKKSPGFEDSHVIEVFQNFVAGDKDAVKTTVAEWSKEAKEKAQQEKFNRLGWRQQQDTTWEKMEVEQSHLGWTVLHMATSLVLPTVVELCLEGGVVNLGGVNDLITPLHLAIENVGSSPPPAPRKKKAGGEEKLHESESSKKETQCPKCHPAPLYTLHKPMSCDICRRNFSTGQTMYGCRICDWDVCTNCEPLWEAREKAHRENVSRIIEALLKAGADVNAVDKAGKTCLARAIEAFVKDPKDDITVLDKLCTGGADVSGTDSQGSTALHLLILQISELSPEAALKALKVILCAPKTCDVNAADKNGNTALHLAVHKCRTEAVSAFDALKVIVERGGRVNERNNRGQSPLMYGLQRDVRVGGGGPADPIELVSEVCALPDVKVNAKDKLGRTALHYCAAFGCSTSATYLLEQSATLEVADNLGNTPLAFAVKNGHEGLSLMFFKQGAKADGEIRWMANKENGAEKPIFETDVTFDSKEEDEDKEKKPEELEEKSESIFHKALIHRWKGLAYLMVYKDVSPTTAVKESYKTGNETMVVRVLQKVPPSRLEQPEKTTGRNLYHVVASMSGSQVKNLDHVAPILLGSKLSTALRDSTDEKATPLHLAAQSGNIAVLKFLLDQESTAETIDMETANSKKTALYLAAEANHLDVVSSLLDSGADPNLSPPEKDSILLAAVRGSKKHLVKAFLDHEKLAEKIDVNSLGPDGRNCLHVAIDNNDVEVCKVLMENSGIDLNAQDKDGNTPIHHVIMPLPGLGSYENTALLQLLVDAGADPTKENKQGHAPLYYAYMCASKTLEEALIATGKVKADENVQEAAKAAVPAPAVRDPLVKSDGDAIDITKDTDALRDKLEQASNEAKKEKKAPPVDPVSDLGNACEIVEDTANDCYYDVLMHVTKAQYGFYGRSMFYKMQLLRHKTKDMYILWTRYGRTGEDGQNQRTPFDDMEKGKKEFEKIFKSKSGNAWAKRVEGFERKKLKYVPLNIVEADKAKQITVKSIDTLVKDNEQEVAECKLPEAVLTFLRAVTDVKSMSHRMGNNHGLRIDEELMPLGQLSRETISKGKEVLSTKIFPKIKQREALVEKEMPDAQAINQIDKDLQDLTNQYYDLIPHSWRGRAVVTLDNKHAASYEADLLENLLDLEVAVRMLAGAQLRVKEIHPAHYVYEALGVGLHPLEEDDPRFKAVCQFAKNSSFGAHKVKNVLCLERPEEAGKFQKDLFPRKLLWHGSNLANTIGILSQGLRIAPAHVPVTGYMYGKGVYFADMMELSAHYTNPHSLNLKSMTAKDGTLTNVMYLFLCEVALGESSEEREPVYMEKAKEGTQSTKALGWQAPDEMSNLVTMDGTTLPTGLVVRRPRDKKNPEKNPILDHNEYIVYDTSQIRMRYVVELRRGEAQDRLERPAVPNLFEDEEDEEDHDMDEDEEEDEDDMDDDEGEDEDEMDEDDD